MSLQNWLGVAGFVLALLNAIQTWRRNRPIVSVHPGDHPREAISIKIENQSNRPITIIKSRCVPDQLHELWDPDREIRAHLAAATHVEINKIIPSGATQEFSFLRTHESGFLLFIFWQSNGAVIFSKLPLIVAMSNKRFERLMRAD